MLSSISRVWGKILIQKLWMFRNREAIQTSIKNKKAIMKMGLIMVICKRNKLKIWEISVLKNVDFSV